VLIAWLSVSTLLLIDEVQTLKAILRLGDTPTMQTEYAASNGAWTSTRLIEENKLRL